MSSVEVRRWEEDTVLTTARKGDFFIEGTLVYARQEAFILPSFKHGHRLHRDSAESFSGGIQKPSGDISE